jgi:uncharacterized protein YdeI (YjbR/CyaY-like superfamily)
MEEQLLFPDKEAFRLWLGQNHNTHKGFWMVLGKGGDLKTISSAEALEEALCFGWIDSLIKRVDHTRYLKKFTPRRKDSVWSLFNKRLVEMLIADGRMTEFGLKAIEAGKKSGAWDNAQTRPTTTVSSEQIAAFTSLLEGKEPAYSNFLKMSTSVKQTYTFNYLDAKTEETRQNRLNKTIQRLNENKKPM